MKVITILETDMESGRIRSWSLPAFSIITRIMGAFLSLYNKPIILDEGKDTPVCGTLHPR